MFTGGFIKKTWEIKSLMNKSISLDYNVLDIKPFEWRYGTAVGIPFVYVNTTGTFLFELNMNCTILTVSVFIGRLI